MKPDLRVVSTNKDLLLDEAKNKIRFLADELHKVACALSERGFIPAQGGPVADLAVSVINDHAQAIEQLTVVQARCTELLEEARAAKAHCVRLKQALEFLVQYEAGHDEFPNIYCRVMDEFRRSNAKHGGPGVHVGRLDGTGTHAAIVRATAAREETESATANGSLTWRHILEEEVAEAFAERDHDRLREELIQVASVAIKWVAAMELRDAIAHGRSTP